MIEDFNLSDPYFMSSCLYSLALSSKDMHDNLSKALFFTKLFFNADNVILYKQNSHGEYEHAYNSAKMNINSSLVTVVLNSAKALLENKKKYEIKLHIENLNNVVFIKINVGDTVYVVGLTGNNQFKNLGDNYVNVFTNTIGKILNAFEQFEELAKSSDIDTLTGLRNRNAYERDLLNKDINDGMIYVIFDLFRLKSINDNYSHQKGDEYIKGAAEILKRQFPKYSYNVDETGKRVRTETGSCIYRVGGDEFVLVSDTETYETAQIKIMIIQDEIKNMNIEVNEPLGINYGLVKAEKGDTLRDLYLKSDDLLSQNKHDLYQELGLERRKQ